jgi:DTW domain-containing protein YfiP
MNTKPLDKTKKSNIKCEHCRFWRNHCYCKNTTSKHYEAQRNYWNRCKQFEWKDGAESEGK